MPSSVIAWTTAAIFYFDHNFFFFWSPIRVPSLSDGISINVDLAHKWTPLHPQPLPYVHTGHIQLSRSNIERRMEKWNRFICVRVANQVRAFACVHSHAHSRPRLCVYSAGIIRAGVWVVRLSFNEQRENNSLRYRLTRLSDCVWMHRTVLELKRNVSHVDDGTAVRQMNDRQNLFCQDVSGDHSWTNDERMSHVHDGISSMHRQNFDGRKMRMPTCTALAYRIEYFCISISI